MRGKRSFAVAFSFTTSLALTESGAIEGAPLAAPPRQH